MRPIRAYVDTSVFGGVCDDEFSEASRRFFRDVVNGRFVIVVSAETVRELQDAPEAVRDVLRTMPAPCLERVVIDREVERLARQYVEAGIVGPASQSDALHVAAATVAEADLILSWNFRHIVNYSRIRMYNGVNALNGHAQIEIRSPLEMLGEDEEEDV